MDELKSIIAESLKRNRDQLWDLNLFIHRNPEIAYEELKASARVAEFIAQQGFDVQHPAAGMETALIATKGNDGPRLAFLAEYDALPQIGHGCGHNLIAVSAVAAAIALVDALSASDSAGGTIMLLGTPAEELLVDSGKMRFIDAGVFEGVDATFSAHPYHRTKSTNSSLAYNEVTVRFRGQSAHAAADPFHGRNAYDALQLSFVGLSFLRQQLRPDARVHWGEIEVGGAKNIIPDNAAAKIGCRARDNEYCDDLARKIIDCAKGAALMTSCEMDYIFQPGFQTLKENSALEKLYEANLIRLGVNIDGPDPIDSPGSADVGNVSQVTPTIQPCFKITEGAAMHSPQFCRAAGTVEAFDAAMTSAQALAMTAADLLVDPKALSRIRRDFQATE